MPYPLRALGLVKPEETAEDLADREAVKRCLGGDRQAFALLVRRHSGSIHALCVRLTGPAMGEELAQEAFARAYASLAGFRADAKVKSWLYRIALNLCRDHLKSGRNKLEAAVDDESLAGVASEQADPESRAEGRQAMAALAAAVDQLTPKYREAFVLKHVENLSYEEMREVVGMPIPALKVRVHRAREMLKKLLGREESES